MVNIPKEEIMEPAELAKNAIEATMGIGSAKDGCNDSWMEKSVSYHLTRAIRHATTALMIYTGLQSADEDGARGHMNNALTRMAMAAWLMSYR